MYNPIENDNYYEWIELYNPTNKSINLTGWTITDNYGFDTLHPNTQDGNGSTLLSAKHYALITDKVTNIYENISTNHTLLLTVDDVTIGNGLGNSDDYLILRNNSDDIIDAIEWGENTPNVNGSPINTVAEGNTLSRHYQTDTNDTRVDFYESINPTPGYKNNESSPGTIKIIMHPRFLPKPYQFQQYSFPIAIHVTFNDFNTNTTFDLKTFISAENSLKPASQTWDGDSWTYSDQYTHHINISKQNSYSQWFYLRLNKKYKAYQDHIRNNNTACITVKIRMNNESRHVQKHIFLLDMDNSTNNATPGGYVIDKAKNNKTSFENKTILLINNTDTITGIYKTENNNISETFVNIPGYFKITSPVGKNYTLSILSENHTIIHTLENKSIRYGHYDLAISIPNRDLFFDNRNTKTYSLHLQNTGDFNDTYHLDITNISHAWNANLETKKISLSCNESTEINLKIRPTSFEKQTFSHSEITIQARSITDPGLTDQLTVFCELIEPDLTIPNIKSYDEQRNENATVAEGKSIRIKAYCKNTGTENASDVTVSFYLDEINQTRLLGTKYYETISKYQKYPSILWDTHQVSPGNHLIWVVVDAADTINELDESNNKRSYTITILDTSPSQQAKQILITELYAYTHSAIPNEYFCIHNPTNQTIDISQWYLTPTPFKTRAKQQKIIFPINTIIEPYTTLTITQNATAFYFETGYPPDFEYKHDANKSIAQMICEKTIVFSNTGEAIALKDQYNHTIDYLHYGNNTITCSFWKGKPIPLPDTAEILIRSKKSDRLIDTNSLADWKHPRKYIIGQSRFTSEQYHCNTSIKTFVSPDCSYRTIIDEINNAQQSIYINIYEIAHPQLCQNLIDALKRKVNVYIFIEGSPIGGISYEQRLILHRLQNYGASIRCIKSDTQHDIYSRYTFNHAKYIIIDNETIIIESCNWMQTGIPKNPRYGNREWGIIIKNKTVASYFHSVFMDDWNPQRCDSWSLQSLNLSLPKTIFIKDQAFYGSYQSCFASKTFNQSVQITPVLSPDTSKKNIIDLLHSANSSIYVQQLYIYKNWNDEINPFVKALVNKSKKGVDVKVILNHNPTYDSTNKKCNETRTYLEKHGIRVKLIYTNWSIFNNVHNKGVIVDNQSVLISSINWNENSVMNNRETGVIIKNKDIASYYADVFFFDWNLNNTMTPYRDLSTTQETMDDNTIYIVSIFTMTFVLIARDWRKRRWN